MIEIRDATPEDADYVATHLREADVIELRAQQPNEPAEAVRRSFRWADWAKVAVVDGTPAILYGVSRTDNAQVGSPWLVSTGAIANIPREYISDARKEVERMKGEYATLFNRVHRDNIVSIRWLKWLGFVVDAAPSGPDGKFFEFWMRS